MQNRSLSLFRRIWKYRLHYAIVLPALVLILLFRIVPFAGDVLMAFKDYKVFRGLFSSPWVGFGNFGKLWADPAFRTALSNTLAIKLAYIACTGIFAFVIALALARIASPAVRRLFSTLFLVPYFIPSLVVAYTVMCVLSPNLSPLFPVHTLALGRPDLFRPLLAAVEALKTCGIPILMALAAIEGRRAASARGANGGLTAGGFVRQEALPAGKAIAAFMLLQLSTLLSTDFELAYSLYNPLVYSTGDTLNTYQFRTGFMMMEAGTAGASRLFQYAVQLLLTLPAYFAVRSWFLRDLFPPGTDEGGEMRTGPKGLGGAAGIAGFGAAAIGSLAALLPLYMLFVYPFAADGAAGSTAGSLLASANFGTYLAADLAAAAASVLMIATLAYPLTVRDLPGHGLYKLFLLAVMGMGGGSFSEYLLFKNVHLVNTVYPQMLLGIIPIVSVFALKSIFNSRYADLKEQASAEGRGELHAFVTLFLPKMGKPLAALGVLQFVGLWNSYSSSLIFMNNPNGFSPVMKLMYLISNGQQAGPEPGALLLFGAVVSLLPLALLLAFRNWLTSGTLISQIRKL